MNRLTRALTILAVNLTLLAVGLVIVELIFGGWLGAGRLNRLNILKNCTLRQDVSSLYRDPQRIIIYSRDQYGLRGRHSAPADIDILTVGGSTTDQRFIRDGETWQDVLQDKFEQAGASVIVANAGVDGQSTFGHIKNFQWWFPNIPGLAPKYILFYVGQNDFHKDAGYAYDALVDDDDSFSLRRSLRQNSAIWHLARTVYGTYQAIVVKKIGHRSVDFNELEWTREPLQDDYAFMQPRLEAYADRLRLLADLTREFGAEPIFVSQPSRHYRVTPEGIEGQSSVSTIEDRSINGVDFHHMIRRLDGITRTVAGEKGALFVDLGNHADWTDADFYDFVHMTPSGARKVGTLLHEALAGLFPAAGPRK